MPIKTGDKAPLFTLQDQDGKPWSMQDYLGKKMLVIYFYPKDETPGCTKEACGFRDNFEAFSDLGCEVVGISGDSVSSHKNFANHHRLPFSLLSDKGNKVRKLFGVQGPLFSLIPGRVTYIIDLSGTVIHTFNSMFNADKHVQEALKIVQEKNS